jgi:TonB family protein
MEQGYYPASPQQLMGKDFYGKDSIGKAFAGSLVTHGVVVGLLVASGLWNLTNRSIGSATTSTGSVGVTMVKTIPIPRPEGPVNPLANDTKSIVPQAPPEALKPQKEVKAEPEDAIAIPDRIEKNKKAAPQPRVQTMFRPPDPYKPNQIYSNIPQQANTPMYGMKGSSGIDVGPDSILGTRFGAYGDLVRDRVAQNWNRASVHASPSQKCAVSFTIARNGAVSNVQVAQPSGNYLLDSSALRAILDSNPLPSLPPQLGRNDVTVKLWFQLTQ